MIVVIEDKIYNPNDCKILIIMNDQDQKNIASMTPEANCFASFPEGSDMTKIGNWMKQMKDLVAEGLRNALSNKTNLQTVSKDQAN